jgi:tRNA(Ile)-lysidine synthase
MQTSATRTGFPAPALALDRTLFRPGVRICVAVSGGADSTALLCALTAARVELGLGLSVLHVNHGIRGAEADADAAFVQELAERLAVPCTVARVVAPAFAQQQGISIETAARTLRYAEFARVLRSGQADAVSTAHTLDDQAETVLMKLLRGAWTEGLSGIHPTLEMQDAGMVLRPLLAVRRAQIEAYLHALGQNWREDSSNRDRVHTRNRVRQDLVPLLRQYNPAVEAQLARMAALARDEEDYWQAEVARLAPLFLLPGRPVRGGGRSVATHPDAAALGLEVQSILNLPRALRRRLLRAAAERLGTTLDFQHTEQLLALVEGGSAAVGRKEQVTAELFARRSARELCLERVSAQSTAELGTENSAIEYPLPVPGAVEATAFGIRCMATVQGVVAATAATLPAAVVRTWRPGDRVTLEHTRGPKKVKEILERIRVHGAERAQWPVVEWQGTIVWMQGVRVDGSSLPPPMLEVKAEKLEPAHSETAREVTKKNGQK